MGFKISKSAHPCLDHPVVSLTRPHGRHPGDEPAPPRNFALATGGLGALIIIALLASSVGHRPGHRRHHHLGEIHD